MFDALKPIGRLFSDGKPIDPYYLKIIKPDTLVIIDRTPGAKPGKRPNSVKQQETLKEIDAYVGHSSSSFERLTVVNPIPKAISTPAMT